MEKKKELWRKWYAINVKCQRKCGFCGSYGTQKDYDYWSKMLRFSAKMLSRLEFMYGLKVHYSAFGRYCWV